MAKDLTKNICSRVYKIMSSTNIDLADAIQTFDQILFQEQLFKRPLDDERNIPKSLIIYAIHRLITFLGCPSLSNRDRKQIVLLQKKLIGFSYVHKPQLFESLLEDYSQSLKMLVEFSYRNQCEVLIVNTFRSEDSEFLREIDENFVFNMISIPHEKLNEFVQCVIDILIYVLDLDCQSNRNSFVNMFEHFVGKLQFLDIYARLKCIKFGIRFFGCLFELDPSLTSNYVSLFNCCQELWEALPNLLSLELLDEHATLQLTNTSVELFKCNYKSFLSSEIDCNALMSLSLSCEGIMLTTIKNQDLFGLKTELKAEILDFIVNLYERTGYFHPQSRLLKLIEEDHQILKLFESVIGHADMTNAMELFDGARIILTKGLCGKLQDFESVKVVLNALAAAEHKSISNQQFKLYKSTKNFKRVAQKNICSNLPFAWNKIEESVEIFLGRVNLADLTYAEAFDYVEISGLLLKIENLVDTFSGFLNVRLIDTILYYLKKPLDYSTTSSLMEQKLFKNALNGLANIALGKLGSNIKIYFETCISELIRSIYQTRRSILNQEICNGMILDFLANSVLSIRQVVEHTLPALVNCVNIDLLTIKSICCCALGNVLIFKYRSKNAYKYALLCEDCDKSDLEEFGKCYDTKWAVVAQLKKKPSEFFTESSFTYVLNAIGSNALFSSKSGVFAINHFLPSKVENAILMSSSLNPELVIQLVLRTRVKNEFPILPKVGTAILEKIQDSLKTGEKDQLEVLQLISSLSGIEKFPEEWLVQFFKMTFFYMIGCGPSIRKESQNCANEICASFGVEPIQLLNSYLRECMNIVVNLSVHIYLKEGKDLKKSLNSLATMLGFMCSQELIYKYYKILIAMILPYCVKEDRCKGLLVQISQTMGKSISEILTASFLNIYSHIYLNESVEIGNKCIDLLVRCTQSTISSLMHTDVKQTVSEFLIFFNRKPEFVMQAFSCLLLNKSTTKSQPTTTEEFALFIAERFLGVITYFEACLSDPNFEKFLKMDVLHSLGQIIRLVGAERVTQSRYKIIAMLTSVISLDDTNLKAIVLKIWNIFLHTVNIQALGPSLSRIVVSLQPLLSTNEKEVDTIYKYLILENGNLLSAYMPDLYFIEDMDVSIDLKNFVRRQTETLFKMGKFEDLLKFYVKQINNENLQVRIRALKYLKEFLIKHRTDLNTFIVGQTELNPLIESVVENLINGCKHVDRTLQLISGKCLGELGAIDPSYMSPNYTKEQKRFFLSIHTDAFAITALTELCRAYQKNIQYVDNMSVAIQDILAIQGVNPKENKKMNVWEAIPVRMRHIMEPLLTSCYTVPPKGYKIKTHPVFGSSFCRTYEDWAYWWAWKLVEFAQDANTKKLLCSFTPSIRKDNIMLALFLPYILLHSLQECSEEEMILIYEELQAVIQQAVRCGSKASDKAAIETSISKEICLTQTLKMATQRGIHSHNVDDACAKICFELIDFLYRWTREWSRISTSAQISNSGKEYGMIQKLLGKIDKCQLAKANFNCGEHARALLFLELYIEENKASLLQENLSFLIEIYAELLDPDSVEGAMHVKKTSLTLPEQILVNNIIDRPQENIACYEQIMIRPELVQQEHVLGIINSYLRLDLPETVLNITSGLWEKLSERYTDDFFKECQFEPLLRLGCYDEIEQILEDPVVSKNPMIWNVQCAKAIRLFRNRTIPLEDFQTEIDEIRLNILSTLKTLGAEHYSYHKSYPDILKLQLLTDVEKNKILVQFLEGEKDEAACLVAVNEFFTDWNARLCFLQPTVRILEPLLCLRRNLLSETKTLLTSAREDISASINKLIDEEMGKLWIRSIQMNREAGGLQQANLSIMKAEDYAPDSLFLEKAKLLWQSGDQTKSLKLISEKINEMEAKGELPSQDKASRLLYSEAKFLQATYNAESMKIGAEQNLNFFKQAISGNKNSEKCLVHMAQYLEKVYAALSDSEKKTDSGRAMLYDIMVQYARAMRAGNESMYQSMPRLLSIWFDFTTQLGENDNANLAVQQMGVKMTDLVGKCAGVLPTYIFYSALSQILSRICHPSQQVFEVIKTIIILLLEKYPNQSLWMLLPVLKSSYAMRAKRCRIILSDKRLSKREVVKFLDDFNSLAEKLIQLTTKEVVGMASSELNVSTLVPKLPKLFEDPNFSQILLPFEKFMQVTLLTGNRTGQGESPTDLASLNPFPNKQIYICGIKEEVVILRSQACPKKITFLCSDGKEYTVMIKPKDDLRYDYRLMEFNALLKRYLHLDPQARQRRLHIRTYAAIPFNEDCGLIEWLPNLNHFRTIVVDIYKSRKIGIHETKELKNYMVSKEESLEKKKHVFKILLSRHPPVFHEWFIYQFYTPHNWYQARSSYIKTTAVMSMVGYILGLGDRHGENVLFDETNGESVHVDFNCLFNKGELFALPERVPFRLTQNMVHAMGPLGIEGLYRKCCEITLTVLQNQKKTLLSVLRPFVYDLSRLGKKTGNNIEKTDPQALENVNRIEERLHGYVQRRGANRMPLSVEGQVDFLINEAIDINNLAVMYTGWGPYL